MATQQGITAPFDIQFDMVPVFYVNTNPAVGSPLARSFERAASKLTAVSPITGKTDQITVALSDPVDLKLLHMITGDPQRDPTFVQWGDADYFWSTGAANCSSPCVAQSPGFAWNHGGIQPEIVRTWLGLAGPGIKNKRLDDAVWSDHTDIRPTMLALVGLKDDYSHEGRVLVEEFNDWAVPDGVSHSADEFLELARAYKQINAPTGPLAMNSLIISTHALEGNDLSDATYKNLENVLANVTVVRDALAVQMETLLEGAAFGGRPIKEQDEKSLTKTAHALLEYMEDVAGRF